MLNDFLKIVYYLFLFLACYSFCSSLHLIFKFVKQGIKNLEELNHWLLLIPHDRYVWKLTFTIHQNRSHNLFLNQFLKLGKRNFQNLFKEDLINVVNFFQVLLNYHSPIYEIVFGNNKSHSLNKSWACIL